MCINLRKTVHFFIFCTWEFEVQFFCVFQLQLQTSHLLSKATTCRNVILAATQKLTPAGSRIELTCLSISTDIPLP
jgi:hypothetical protein